MGQQMVAKAGQVLKLMDGSYHKLVRVLSVSMRFLVGGRQC